MKRTHEIADQIAVLMPQIARQILMEFFTSVEITQTQLFVVITLQEKGCCRLSELSKDLRVSAPTVTGIIDRLEKSGHVQRIPDIEDRRAINIQLTPRGNDLAKRLRTTVQNRWRDIIEKLPLSDSENYLKILHKIKNLFAK